MKVSKTTIRRAFRKFLFDNDALEAWYKNTRRSKRISINVLLAGNSYSYINNAFYWDDSPEGFDFWNKLDDKWSEMLEAMVN